MELTMTNSFGFCELNQNELENTDGGLIIEIISSVNFIAYAVDTYNYYKETKYVTSYNETVTANNRYDLVKPNPSKPQLNPFYIFTR